MAELICWTVLLVLTIAGLLALFNLYQNQTQYIDDLDSWMHNYAKLQRRL